MSATIEKLRFSSHQGAQRISHQPATTSQAPSRLASIDAARGAAMMFVCLSHFANYYPFAAVGAWEVGAYLYAIGMIASPTFVTVSGMMAGFMSVARPRSFEHFRRKLIDRGVFLLLIGHAVLALTVVLAGKSFAFGYSIEYITDAIALAVIFGPTLVRRITQRTRAAIAILIFAVDWVAVLFWSPSAASATLAKHYLVGLLSPDQQGVPFPAFAAVPWFAVYLMGTVIGEKVGEFYRRENRFEGHLILARVGLVGFLVGIATKVGLITVKHQVPGFAQAHPHLMPLLSSYEKYPPGPVYLCFYAGAGLLLVAGVMEAGRRGVMRFLFDQLSQVGQASLFSFVIQAPLYSVILPRLGLDYTHLWPLQFLLSLVVLVIAARLWNSIEGNRFLTVGIGPYLDHRDAKRQENFRRRVRVDAAFPAA